MAPRAARPGVQAGRAGPSDVEAVVTEEAREPSAQVWRTGEAGRTIWWGDHVLHGIVGTPEIAARICEAMNDIDRTQDALQAIVDEITDDAHEDHDSDADAMMDSSMKILDLAKQALRSTSAKPSSDKST